MTRRLRVGVVGLGVGAHHVAAFTALPELYEMVAVADLDADRRAKTAAEHGVPHAVSDLDAMLALPGLDLVSICTPPDSHAALIERGLAAGLHVVCEKPLVGSLADVDRLAELDGRGAGRIHPIFQYRFGHGLQKLKALVAAGLAGPAYLTTIETAWTRGADYYATAWRGKWRTEMGGVCLTQAIHAHDMLCYILGPIARVHARVATRVNPIEVEDCAAVSVEMADGSLATLSATLGSAEQISRLRFCFRELTAESNLDPYKPSRDPWRFIGRDEAAQARIDAALAGFDGGLEYYEGQFARMHAAITAGAPDPVTLADARASLELITGIYHSARTGDAVTFPVGADHPLYRGWLP
jgi:predicted dehydrogenase